MIPMEQVTLDPESFYGVMNRLPKPTDTKRCLTCSQYFTEKDSAERVCLYHHGTFKTVLTLHSYGASQGKWSCCGKQDRQSAGCTTGLHIEDKKTTQLLNHFNVGQDSDETQPTNNSLNQGSNPSDNASNVTEAPEKELDGFVRVDGKLYFRHPVASTDTIAGLALKYNTKAIHVKQLNKLFDDKQLYSKKHVLVPWHSEKLPENSDMIFDEARKTQERDQKHVILKRFQREHGLSKEEATYYMEETEYNYEKATKQFKDDLVLEKNEERNSLEKTRKINQIKKRQ